MSKQLREHIRTQLKTLLESKYGYYKDKDGRIKQGDLATAWKERIKSAVEDEEDRKDLSLKNVMKGIKDEEDIKEATPEEVDNAKKILDLEKKTTQEKKKQSDLDNMEEAELSPKQKKIAQAAPPPDKITGADFAALKSKKKLKEYINEMIPSLLEVDEEEGQEDDAFVPNHYKPEFIPREAEQALEKLGLTPIDRYVDFVNFMNSIPKSLKVVLTNGNSFLMYFDEDGLRLQIGANEIDISDDRTLPEAQDMINDLLMGPVDVPEEEEEAVEEVPEEEPAAEEEPTEEEPAEEEPEA
tara:strand:+ start:2523 stop:3416 length:894 start_codon:yes stop_codon:yes gene_type:complete